MFNQFLVQPIPTPQINFCLEESFRILRLLSKININNEDFNFDLLFNSNSWILDSPSRPGLDLAENLT